MSTSLGVGQINRVLETQTLVAYDDGGRRQEQWIPNGAFESDSIRGLGDEGEITVKDDFIDGSNSAYPRVRLGTHLHNLRRAKVG